MHHHLVQFLRGVRAEWAFLRVRLMRTRLGVWLVLLAGTLVWLERTAATPDVLDTALRAGALGAAIAIAYLAGGTEDRAALAVLLLQPTTPRAVAAGRWLAASGAAALVVTTTVACSIWRSGALASGVRAVGLGLVAAAAVAGFTLLLAWLGGNVLVGSFFLSLAIAGEAPADRVMSLAPPGLGRLATGVVMVLVPSPWRYRGLAAGDLSVALHAALWIGIGVIVASELAARRAGIEA